MRKARTRSGEEYREVIYSASHWNLLKLLRLDAIDILLALKEEGVKASVIGSAARGDVHRGSDIDVFIVPGTPYFIVENALLKHGFTIESVRIVKATPYSSLRVVYSLGGKRYVSLLLGRPSIEEEEFPKYAGCLDLRGLRKDIRVKGVNKKLWFIEPIEKGHREWYIVGREEEVARALGISLETVASRVAHRVRRYKMGRRGLYIDVTVPYGRHVKYLQRLGVLY